MGLGCGGALAPRSFASRTAPPAGFAGLADASGETTLTAWGFFWGALAPRSFASRTAPPAGFAGLADASGETTQTAGGFFLGPAPALR